MSTDIAKAKDWAVGNAPLVGTGIAVSVGLGVGTGVGIAGRRVKDSPLEAITIGTCVPFLEINSKEEMPETGTELVPLSGIAVGAESARATLTDGSNDEKNRWVTIPQTNPSAMTSKISIHRKGEVSRGFTSDRFLTVSSFHF